MKHQSTLTRQRAAIQQGPRKSIHAIIRLQEDAERKALIDGDEAEAKRAKDAVINLEARRRRLGRGTSEPMPKALIDALGGAYDPICKLVKSRVLAPAHARVALALRDHVEGGTIVIGARPGMEFVQGGICEGLEAMTDARRIGQQAWDTALRACGNPGVWSSVDLMIRGKVTQKQAIQRLGMVYNDKSRKLIQRHLIKALNAAGAFLGIG